MQPLALSDTIVFAITATGSCRGYCVRQCSHWLLQTLLCSPVLPLAPAATGSCRHYCVRQCCSHWLLQPLAPADTIVFASASTDSCSQLLLQTLLCSPVLPLTPVATCSCRHCCVRQCCQAHGTDLKIFVSVSDETSISYEVNNLDTAYKLFSFTNPMMSL